MHATALAHPARVAKMQQRHVTMSNPGECCSGTPNPAPARVNRLLCLSPSTSHTVTLGKSRRYCGCSRVCSCNSFSCALVACFWQRRPWPEQSVKQQRRRSAGCYISDSASCNCCGLSREDEGSPRLNRGRLRSVAAGSSAVGCRCPRCNRPSATPVARSHTCHRLHADESSRGPHAACSIPPWAPRR
jgi:hypothetical protein